MKVTIHHNSSSFAIVLEKPLVSDADDVPVVLAHNFRRKSEYTLLSPSAQNFLKIIDEQNGFIWFSVFYFAHYSIIPRCANDVFVKKDVALARFLTASIAKAFKTKVQVVVKKHRLPQAVFESFSALPNVTVQ